MNESTNISKFSDQLLVHNNLLTILINTTINRFSSMLFIKKNVCILSDLITTNFTVNYNKTNIFDFIICSNLYNVSYINSTHDSFNFSVRHDDVIDTNKFINKIETLVLSIINNHNLIRSLFRTIKPFDMADKLFLDSNIFISIEKDSFVLNIRNCKIIHSDIETLANNDELLIYKKISLKTIFQRFVC